MSNYNFLAINKITKEEQPIEALDNYFGRHKYGYLVKDEILTSEEFFSKYDEAGVDVGGDTPDMIGEFTPKYHQDQLHKIGLGDTAEKECPHHAIESNMCPATCRHCGIVLVEPADPIPETEGWEKEFEEMYLPNGDLYTQRKEKTRAFIRKAVSSAYLAGVEKKIPEVNISMLRQWLNEDRITDPKKMVSNEEIKHWLLSKSNEE